jgi:hypothetical protein
MTRGGALDFINLAPKGLKARGSARKGACLGRCPWVISQKIQFVPFLSIVNKISQDFFDQKNRNRNDRKRYVYD